MYEALVARLRADAGVAGAAGVVRGRPAVDLHERKSDAAEAFPAVVITTLGAGRLYDQDGAGGLENPRVRFECFGLSAGDSIVLARAVRDAIEAGGETAGVRFHRGKLRFERSFPPEDVATLKIFRTIIDMDVPATF